MYRLAALVPLLLGLVGCAGLTGLVGTPGVPDRDLCQLLTVAEIDQLWGWPNTKPESEQGQRGPTCGWRDQESSQETGIRLNLSPLSAIPCDQLRNSPNSRAIAGVGDWAYWSEDRQEMYVAKGNNCLEVIGNYVGDPDIDYMTNLTELARLAAGRL